MQIGIRTYPNSIYFLLLAHQRFMMLTKIESDIDIHFEEIGCLKNCSICKLVNDSRI
jgi:uncharacterized protein YuzB (UPF0349 family)